MEIQIKQKSTLERHIEETTAELDALVKQESDVRDAKRSVMTDIAVEYATRMLGEAYVRLEKGIAENNEQWKNLEGKKYYTDWDGTQRKKDKEDLREKRLDLQIPVLDLMVTKEVESRVVSAYALGQKGLIGFGCESCFGDYKSPSECGKCNLVEENVKQLGIEEYFLPEGHRVYRADRKRVEKVIFERAIELQNYEQYSLKIFEARSLEEPDSQVISALREKKKILQLYQHEEAQKIASVKVEIYLAMEKRLCEITGRSG